MSQKKPITSLSVEQGVSTDTAPNSPPFSRYTLQRALTEALRQKYWRERRSWNLPADRHLWVRKAMEVRNG